MTDHSRLGRLSIQATAAATLLASPAVTSGQPTAEWRLSSSPTVVVGRSGVDLHRVRGAALLSDGQLAVADAGNYRILIMSRDGDVARSIGGEGTGPGEFRGLARVSVIGDTLIAYDAILQRVVVYMSNGTHLATRPVPSFQNRPIFYIDALSASQYSGFSPLRSGTDQRGLFLDSLALFVMNAAPASLRRLTSREWQYQYTIAQEAATSTYAAPFLGRTHIAAVGDHMVMNVLGGSTVEILDSDGRLLKQLVLPTPRRPFERTAVEQYRDSLLEAVTHSSVQVQGAQDRIQHVFGAEFPVPRGVDAPSIDSAVAVDNMVWLKSMTRSSTDMGIWYAVDPMEGRLVASIRVPRTWTILGGSAGSVLVTARDELDVEYVAVHTLQR